MPRCLPQIVAALLLLPAPAWACLWDMDTLKEESLSHKDVAAIASGRILKHSPFFYEQKIAYTQPLIEGPGARPQHYDDLAVAHDKLGRHAEAIALMEAKERRFPGLYTTASNLGTLLVHAGRLDEGLSHLRRALTIDPNAHFGREKYQVRLIEYLLRLAREPDLPQREDLLGTPITGAYAYDYVYLLGRGKSWLQPRVGPPAFADDVLPALAGLIRFGSQQDSPHVWFSLGVALAWRGDKQLALRAMVRARDLGHKATSSFIDLLSKTIYDLNRDSGPDWFEVLGREKAQGEAWVRQQQEREDALLRAGKARQVFGY